MIDNLLIAAEHLVGFAIVVLVLCILWALTALVGFIFASKAKTANAAAASALASAPKTAAAIDITEEELAVLAAAVDTLIDQRHRIVSIRSNASRWGAQGRSDIHASHRIR